MAAPAIAYEAGDWFLNAAVRYLTIQTDAKLDGVKVGKVKIEPRAFGLSFG